MTIGAQGQAHKGQLQLVLGSHPRALGLPRHLTPAQAAREQTALVAIRTQGQRVAQFFKGLPQCHGLGTRPKGRALGQPTLSPGQQGPLFFELESFLPLFALLLLLGGFTPRLGLGQERPALLGPKGQPAASKQGEHKKEATLHLGAGREDVR